MNKFENVDIVNSLRRIMNTNTKQYKSDFIYDVNTIQKAAESNNQQDKRLLFMSRPNGTYCFFESDTFKKNSPAYNIWKFYGEQTKDKICAYAVKITGIKGSTILGNLYELNYTAHFKHVKESAVTADFQTVHYKKGDIDIPVSKSFSSDPHPRYGEFISSEIKPNDIQKLKTVLEKEHIKYEKLPCGDIENHITELLQAAVREHASKAKLSVREQLKENKGKIKSLKPKHSVKKEDLSI